MIRVFKNTRTGISAAELRGYKTEDEDTAMARLKAAGWNFNIEYYWDDTTKTFFVGKMPDVEDGEDEGEDSE